MERCTPPTATLFPSPMVEGRASNMFTSPKNLSRPATPANFLTAKTHARSSHSSVGDGIRLPHGLHADGDTLKQPRLSGTRETHVRYRRCNASADVNRGQTLKDDNKSARISICWNSLRHHRAHSVLADLQQHAFRRRFQRHHTVSRLRIHCRGNSRSFVPEGFWGPI